MEPPLSPPQQQVHDYGQVGVKCRYDTDAVVTCGNGDEIHHTNHEKNDKENGHECDAGTGLHVVYRIMGLETGLFDEMGRSKIFGNRCGVVWPPFLLIFMLILLYW